MQNRHTEPLPEPMMTQLTVTYYVTRPEWVNPFTWAKCSEQKPREIIFNRNSVTFTSVHSKRYILWLYCFTEAPEWPEYKHLQTLFYAGKLWTLLQQRWITCLIINNRPNSQFLKCTCPISHNAPLRTEMCTFRFWMVIVGYETSALWDLRDLFIDKSLTLL